MRQQKFRAQSLVEYALILGLVALAAIVILVALGLGLQRVYGLIVGALGENGHGHLSSVHHTITIDTAQCIAVASQHQTGLWVLGFTDEPDFSTVHGSTEFGINTIGPYQSGYVFRPWIDTNKADINECPASVVIQATDGTIAAAPLVKVND